MPHVTEKIRDAYKSKYKLKRENQVILLTITDGKKWHYFAVKKLYALFRGIISSNKGSFYYLNCLHSYCTKDEKHENVCKNHDYCYDETSKEEKKIKT